ncbi:MAG TPA: hypothetical protein VGL77_13040 [Armatimonadota bacterium]
MEEKLQQAHYLSWCRNDVELLEHPTQEHMPPCDFLLGLTALKLTNRITENH